MRIAKRIIILTALAPLLLTSCNKEEMYSLAYDAIDKLQTLIINPETVFIKNAFYGKPPVEDYGNLILIMYNSINSESVRVTGHFAYESEELYYTGLDAVALYEHRDYYYQLDSKTINAHYGFDI